jgi:hypothetical protein
MVDLEGEEQHDLSEGFGGSLGDIQDGGPQGGGLGSSQVLDIGYSVSNLVTQLVYYVILQTKSNS